MKIYLEGMLEVSTLARGCCLAHISEVDLKVSIAPGVALLLILPEKLHVSFLTYILSEFTTNGA